MVLYVWSFTVLTSQPVVIISDSDMYLYANSAIIQLYHGECNY